MPTTEAHVRIDGAGKGFDRLAPWYPAMEWLLAGKKLQRCRLAHLHRVRHARRILILGEGSGRFLCACRQEIPEACIDVVDASSGMLLQARKALQRAGLSAERVQFIHTDVLTWENPGAGYDLVVTHFFLDCFPPETLPHVIRKLAAATTTDADWLLADFRIPEKGILSLRARAIHSLMYAFFRIATQLPARKLTPPDTYLKLAGYELVDRKIFEWELLHSDVWKRHFSGTHQIEGSDSGPSS